MTITRKLVAEKLTKYLKHEITQAELVDWAENAVMEGDFEETYVPQIREAVGRLGVADVKEFGLLWEDCESIMRSMGYELKIDVIRAA